MRSSQPTTTNVSSKKYSSGLTAPALPISFGFVQVLEPDAVVRAVAEGGRGSLGVVVHVDRDVACSRTSASQRMMCAVIGSPATGTSGFGTFLVSG